MKHLTLFLAVGTGCNAPALRHTRFGHAPVGHRARSPARSLEGGRIDTTVPVLYDTSLALAASAVGTP